ncbi:MAG: formylglycine-rating enzyme family protein [Bacteroidetes bacterium]|nr:formylglycine-rating enzyme family protein [Bacteroidota bacterium]
MNFKNLLIAVILLLTFTQNVNAQSYPSMILVEGGTFSMGNEHTGGWENEYPIHKVTVKTFKIAKTETTVEQWMFFCSATGRFMPQPPNWGWISNHPIVNINWQDAVDYCNWLSQRTNTNYRLPTEAEWEYAARGGSLSKGTRYSGGHIIENVGWYEVNGGDKTHVVATKKANELGIYDMSGNVWEWCADWYDDKYYNISPMSNPKGPDLGSYKVLRGGSWACSAMGCRVVFRSVNSPLFQSIHSGFRVVQAL